MYTKPTILPLNVDETICAMQDHNGTIIGTGTREVCEVLVHIINDQTNASAIREGARGTIARKNIRSAIVI
jgi:hypothetical protein